MAVDPGWGCESGLAKMGVFHKWSRFIPFCPRLSLFGLFEAQTRINLDKRGETGTEQKKFGQFEKTSSCRNYPPPSQGRKRNPNPNFWWVIFGWVGVFHVKGWGPKSSVCPSKPRETKLFGAIFRDFAGIFSGVLEKFEKKGLCSILVP